MTDGLGSRTSSTQAMLSLVSAYDDDAEEDKDRSMEKQDHVAEGGDDDMVKEEESLDDQFTGSEDEESESKTNSKMNSPAMPSTGPSSPKHPRLEKRVMKLVSYGDQLEDGDEEEEDDEGPYEDEDDNAVANIDGSASVEYTSSMGDEIAHVRGSGLDGEDLLPPEPKGKCSKHLQEKVAKLYEKKQRGMDLNQNIQRKKEFRNPSIYEKLIQFCGINEKGTNYPPELYDPSIFGPESFYTELAKAQKEEMDKREKERKDKTKIEFVSGVKKESSSKIPERKSKWDTQGAKGGPEVVSSSIQTSASGNKTTVISAVGTLKKSKS